MCSETPVRVPISPLGWTTHSSVSRSSRAHENSPTMVSERRARRSRCHSLRECWMAHKDQTGSLQSTLVVHTEMKEIFSSRKQQQHQWLKKAPRSLFRKMVKVSWSSNIWSMFWPGLQLLLHWISASVVSSHRQINIPRFYICQYFYPSHVLEHWKYAEIWWCQQMHESCKHLYVFNTSFNTRRVCHQKNSTRWTQAPSDIESATSNIAPSCSFSQELWVHPGAIIEELHPHTKKLCSNLLPTRGFHLKFLLELSMHSSPLVLLCLFPHEYPVSVCNWGKLWQSCRDILASFRYD